jgi:hypothetical protein
MLHTLSPLAGGSPHNGLQIISFRFTAFHFLQPFSHRTLKAVLPINYLQVKFVFLETGFTHLRYEKNNI